MRLLTAICLAALTALTGCVGAGGGGKAETVPTDTALPDYALMDLLVTRNQRLIDSVSRDRLLDEYEKAMTLTRGNRDRQAYLAAFDSLDALYGGRISGGIAAAIALAEVQAREGLFNERQTARYKAIRKRWNGAE